MIPAHFDLNDSLDQLALTTRDLEEFELYGFLEFDAEGFLNHSPEDAQ